MNDMHSIISGKYVIIEAKLPTNNDNLIRNTIIYEGTYRGIRDLAEKKFVYLSPCVIKSPIREETNKIDGLKASIALDDIIGIYETINKE
jgi:hypothetical protein